MSPDINSPVGLWCPKPLSGRRNSEDAPRLCPMQSKFSTTLAPGVPVHSADRLGDFNAVCGDSIIGHATPVWKICWSPLSIDSFLGAFSGLRLLDSWLKHLRLWICPDSSKAWSEWA